MIIRHRKYFAQGILFIFLSLTVVIPEGTILCLGEEGHKALEFVDRCINSITGHTSHLMIEHHQANDNSDGPCFDIPAPDNLSVSRGSHQNSADMTFALSTASPLIFPGIAIGQSQPFTAAIQDIPLHTIKSAVLRI